MCSTIHDGDVMLKNEVKAKRKEKGQSLVELAGALVVMLWLLSGIVDVGRAIFTQFSMQDASEEGIIYGTANPTHCDQIRERVQFNLTHEVLPDDIVVVVTIRNSDTGVWESCDAINPAKVYYGVVMRVSTTQTFVMSMPFLAGRTIPLTAVAEGMILRPQPPDS